MKWNRVGVLLGGMSAEREVSLASGRAVAAGLRRAGYLVAEIDADSRVDERLRAADVEAVYIALHGRLGEDGTIQGLLEMLRIPYTGSSVLASAVAMDKLLTRQMLEVGGVPIAPGFALSCEEPIALPAGWALPVVVKPTVEGSSVGVTIVRDEPALQSAVSKALEFGPRALVEQFLEGPEITVAVLDGRALGVLEIEPHREFYDFSAKYASGGSTHHVPPRLPADVISRARSLGEKAYATLGCSGAARVDFIAVRGAEPVALEVNTIPGMTERSLLPEIAAWAGISFDQLVSRIMESAVLHVHPRISEQPAS